MIRSILLAAALALPKTLPASAQNEPQPAVAALMHYMDNVEPCLAIADTAALAQSCIGASSSVCMDTEADGYSTLGMMFCTLAEKEEWDRLLNDTYQDALRGLAELDAQDAELFPEYAQREALLRDAQRAWIGLRDGDCALEYAMWGAGSIRQIAGASCLLQMTAERTISLKFLGDYMR